jgi:ribosomal protein L11 methyltransferase
MDYIEVRITGFTGFDPEIVMAQMAELGFESFSESESGIQAFTREDMYQEDIVSAYLQKLCDEHGLRYSVHKIEAQNWNAIWESGYEPVTIAGKCQVRAPFHEPVAGLPFDIVIEPRMSFGTAHHETTSLMLELLMEEEVNGKRVLDMGCGTGVIAILAHKMLAAQVVAIDNDEWAYSNALDNMEKNNALAVTVLQGEAGDIPMPGYDLIIANINRNVLLSDIPLYVKYLNPDGVLLLSGFYLEDLDQIRLASEKAGLLYASFTSDNNWVGAKFVKLRG